MKVIYMDESGKNIITQTNQQVFIFGGVIVDKDRLYDALAEFKTIYQDSRKMLKKRVKTALNGIPEKERSDRTELMFRNFEFHAVKMFNRKDKQRGTKLIEENPWKYCQPEEIFKIINSLFIKLKPYLNSIYMFKVDKQAFIEYCNNNTLVASDNLVYDKMIDLILTEYNEMLKKEDKKGAIVPDRLDSQIRDKFVDKARSNLYEHFWTEPITVDSDSNAFTQLIDIITYCYYKIYINDKKMNNFKAIKKVYDNHIKSLVIEKDLVEFLSK